MANVAIYGGAFDPPHIAHLFAVTGLLARADVDEVWLLPAADHVFGKEMASFDDRVAMLRAAIEPLASAAIEICEIEAEREGVSRSYDTLELLSATHPEHSFLLALGADNLTERHRWHRFDELVERWPVVAFGRPGHQAALAEVRDEPWCRPAACLPDISSTAIRAALRGGGDPIALDALPDTIRTAAAALYGPVPTPPVQILGAGRAGRALASALRGGGLTVRVWNRSPSDHADAHGPLPDLSAARTWLLCVHDGVLAEVATRLAAEAAGSEGHVALHCAGRLGADVLAPLAAAGVETGSLHPLQSLRGDPSMDRLAGSFCAVEGSAVARQEAERLVGVMGAHAVTLPDGAKGAYHAAAVFAANFCTVLGAGGVALLHALGVPATTARDMLVPLLRGTIEHFAATEGPAALTGPFSRGDLEAVADHVAALRQHAPEWLDAYAALARASAEWLGWPAERRARLEQLLS